MSADDYKKVWTFQSSSVDAIRIVVRLPMMILAPFFLSAQEIEAVQSAICGVNKANISNVYHQEMERIANMSSIVGVEVFVGYGRSFGLADGSSDTMWTLFDEIAEGKGMIAAKSAEAVAYLQLFQDLVGNTIVGFLRTTLKGKKRQEQNLAFETFFFIYYFPLYVLMAAGTSVLRFFPANEYSYKLVTLIQTIFAAVFLIPFGLIGLLVLPIVICTGASTSPLPSRMDYSAIPDDDVEGGGPDTFTAVISKPARAAKVGIRFGSNTSGQAMITNIKQGSIAASSDLEIGDLVFSINGKSLVGRSPREAASTLLAASGNITVEATHADSSVMNEESTV